MSATADLDFREFARSVGKLLDINTGDVLYYEGEDAQFMYVLLSGVVAIHSRDKHLQTLMPGKAFGIVSLLDGQSRTARAVVVSQGQVAMLDRKKLRYMIDEVPHFCRYLIDELTQRLRAINTAQ